jgi:dual specificity MAP kinase phosphatase
MATIALPRPVPAHRASSAITPLSPALSLETISTTPTPQCAVPIPNKHIPVCPPGPVRAEQPSTPPPSPGNDDESLQASLLYPPHKYNRIESGRLSIYKLNTSEVSAAIEYIAQQPLPDPSQVFPWLHGLHPHNQIQQTFFIARRRALRKTPCCLRGVSIVKADGDLSISRLKGAIAPHEFMQIDPPGQFLDVDPPDGFSVRNFQIQAAKVAMTSDIIVYGEDDAVVRKWAWEIAAAQLLWRENHGPQSESLPIYNTFICVSPFKDYEEKFSDIVSVDSCGRLTGNILDFFQQERREMYTMTKASEISRNVWMGPTPDPALGEGPDYDILIECSDLARLNPSALQEIAETEEDSMRQAFLDFPSSGSILPPTWSHAEADGILETCKWIYHLSHGTYPIATQIEVDTDGDTSMVEESEPNLRRGRPKTILLHCADGYTESAMLGIAYYSYSTGFPVPEAWLKLHTSMRRNFFAYPTDVALLTAIAPRLLHESPVCANKSLSEITALVKNEPKWLPNLDGSFPSRVLDYMYLGNLGHASNPDLLRALGIGQILSVGETAIWRDGEREEWGLENECIIQGVQDNGIDPLTDDFERCLEFIGTPT